jgi:hypothetical protein
MVDQPGCQIGGETLARSAGRVFAKGLNDDGQFFVGKFNSHGVSPQQVQPLNSAVVRA